MNSLFLALSLLFPPVLHDHFISICTIDHDMDEKKIEITWRMTTHDLELALAPHAGGEKLHLGSELELPAADSLLQNYLVNNLIIEIDGQPAVLEYLGRDVEMEDMYCYLQIIDVGPFKTMTVQNTLLFDTFDQQENAVHLETDQGTLTHSFRSNSLPYTFMPLP